MTIRDLHKLAYTRMPKEQVHLWLHESAVAMGRASLRDCTPAELDELAMHVRQIPIRPRTGPQGPRADAYGPRERGHGSPETLKRSRRGTGHNPALKLISPKQMAFIFDLVLEIGWSRPQLEKWLRTTFEVDSVEALATSQNGQEAIRRLLRIKTQKARAPS